ncbi:MAG TPA: exodeoxyribonuclease VII small subunit [Dehalococcoidia bacterium]|jgi:exodeoxyribonuclease VII small subunit
MASKKAPETEGFETLYKQLEETVAKLEQGNLSLEESLSQYEAGTALAKRCQALLQDAELRVTRLQSQFNETLLREEPVDYDAAPEFDEEPVD